MSIKLPSREEHLDAIEKEHRLTSRLPPDETLVLLRVEALLIEQNVLLAAQKPAQKKPKSTSSAG